jgi:hypothetical protein
MKQNRDLFIKYLDNILTEDEKRQFEKRLKMDPAFRNEFEHFNEKLQSIKFDVKVDERYFNNLLPNAKKRVEKGSFNLGYRYVYLIPIIILVIIFNYSDLFFEKYNNEYDFQEILESFTENEEITIDLIDNALDAGDQIYYDDKILEEFYGDTVIYDETLFSYLEENLSINEIDNDLINQLSENEFNEIFDELRNKQIIGVK